MVPLVAPETGLGLEQSRDLAPRFEATQADGDVM